MSEVMTGLAESVFHKKSRMLTDNSNRLTLRRYATIRILQCTGIMNVMELNSVPEKTLDACNMKGMVQKNSVEKLEYAKKKRTIEKQKKYFVRQHSRDENEIKQILQRLQNEQSVREPDSNKESEYTGSYSRNDGSDEEESENVITNPYPLIIVPKFGPPTPLKDAENRSDSRQNVSIRGTRKSLEYENINSTESRGMSSFRATVLAASFINKLQAPLSSRKQNQSEKTDDGTLWEGDPEYISSIRRPRKSIADQSHKKILRRAKSEIWKRPDSSHSNSSGSISVSRVGSGKQRNKSVDESGVSSNVSVVASTPRRISFRESSTCGATGNYGDAPDSSPPLSRKGSWNSKKGGENYNETQNPTTLRKSSKGRKQGTIENPFLCQSEDRRDGRKSELNGDTKPDSKDIASKENTKDMCNIEKESEGVHGQKTSPRRKSSLKKKNSNDGTVANASKKEETETGKSPRDSSRKTSMSRTRHSSLKEKKSKKGGIKDSLSLEYASLSPRGARPRSDSITKPRSYSTGCSPNDSPATSPFVKDSKFEY